jgi:hypothetical protein
MDRLIARALPLSSFKSALNETRSAAEIENAVDRHPPRPASTGTP